MHIYDSVWGILFPLTCDRSWSCSKAPQQGNGCWDGWCEVSFSSYWAAPHLRNLSNQVSYYSMMSSSMVISFSCKMALWGAPCMQMCHAENVECTWIIVTENIRLTCGTFCLLHTRALHKPLIMIDSVLFIILHYCVQRKNLSMGTS